GFETGQVLDAAIAQSDAQREAFWHLRENIANMLIEDKSCLKSDTAVPVGQVPAFIDSASRAVLARLPDARLTPFGHLGDGNVHSNVVRPENMSPQDFRALWHDLAAIIAEESLALGGTISAEHGIGRHKRDDLLQFADPVTLGLMQRIKAAVDPEHRMNIGVLF